MDNKTLNKDSFPKELRMYTRDELALMLGTHKDTISMLEAVGCISAIKMGKRYMFSFEAIQRFEKDYEGMDVSNCEKACEAYHEVQKRKHSLQ